jgi:exonuclease SbcC
MQLKSIALRNIRSYSSLNLDFEIGSTLLSGDIGSGKTTILLSLEFALFGLMKGMISGAALLRHGCKDASVTLEFNIDKTNYRIYRSLKKNASGIGQDSGYLEINNQRTDYTAVELKSKILSILGYPDELLTKSKSLIFRYTVYTPQEEMKQIIFDSEEERLEKLTKIFSIDKYKRIRENAENYAKELRAETKILTNIEREMSELDSQQKKCEEDMETRSIGIQQIALQIIEEEKILKDTEDKIKATEETIKNYNTLKQEIKILNLEKNNLVKNSETAKFEISSLELQKKKIQDELSKEIVKKEHKPLSEINDELLKYKQMKDDTEKKIIEAKSVFRIAEKKIEESSDLKKKIGSLTVCPTCQQEVNESHKHHIFENEENKNKELEQKKLQAKTVVEKAENNLAIIAKRITALEKEILESKEEEQKTKMRNYYSSQLESLDEKIMKNKQKLAEFEQDLKSNKEIEEKLNSKIKDIQIDETEVSTLAKKFREAKDMHLALKVKESAINQSIKELNNNLERIASEKKTKKEFIDILLKKKTLEHWLSNHFINLVEVIEKNVMGSIRAEFKEHFEDWFNMLIEDESLSATLDERFTPKISQNGYDTDIENLSGGEKTSVALAYRLALNKVINNIISTIKTKDLLILDEPTDGFSSHQLDKVREVLEALNSKQTLIVSHESKMESFVDHIVKIRKHEHASEVV